MSKLTVHVGGARDMGRRFAAAFEQAAAGKNVEERHVTFLSLEEMMAALTPKRLDGRSRRHV
jgi:predicted transcriptional regulator